MSKSIGGEFPPPEVADKMKVGDKYLWIPDYAARKWGCTPVMYIVEERRRRGKKRVIHMPYFTLHAGALHG